MICTSCGKENECRPYGDKAAMVCWGCINATPETRALAELHFLQQLSAAGPNPVIGMEQGPFPAEHLGDTLE